MGGSMIGSLTRPRLWGGSRPYDPASTGYWKREKRKLIRKKGAIKRRKEPLLLPEEEYRSDKREFSALKSLECEKSLKEERFHTIRGKSGNSLGESKRRREGGVIQQP